MAILSVNAGSSSLKFSLHQFHDHRVDSAWISGSLQGLEPGGTPTLDWSMAGQSQHETLSVDHGDGFASALQRLRGWLRELPGMPPLRAVAHRVVHGGADFSQATRVTPEVMTRLAQLNSLAPLHQPHNLAGIQAMAQAFPDLPQIACFDTAFHVDVPPLHQRFGLPRALHDQGVRRYGFHGLSYQYILQSLQRHSTRANQRLLLAHLGNGASLCAVRDGRSLATTMGFSALDGLMMGTRSGALDPGVLLYLLEQGWDHPRLERLLYKESGLLGVSGISADVRRLRQSTEPAAQEALALFTHRVVREAGAMVACLQGLDVMAFSGGIGEHDATLRAEVCDALAWMGVKLDPERNLAARGDAMVPVQARDSRIEVWVIPTDEGRVAAQQALAWLEQPASSP
jgi:acetate kinase